MSTEASKKSYQRQSDWVENQRYRDFIAPSYWGTWLLLGLLWLLSRLPFSVMLWMGRQIGRLLYYVTVSRRRICEINLRLCFPELSDKEHTNLVKATYRSYGMGLMETLSAWLRPPSHLLDQLEILGFEHLEQALAEGRGVILAGGHFAIMDLAAYFFSTLFKFNAIQRQQNNLLLNLFVTRARLRSIDRCIARKDLRGMLKILKRGGILWYPPDQDFGPKESVFVPFFGIQTATITSTSRLAGMTGACVLPCSFLRLATCGYQMRVYPPLPIPSGDETEDARLYSHWLEQLVREYPDQYLWFHRRFKTRPEGEASFY